MILAGKVWNDLDENERAHLLIAVYPQRSDVVIKLESEKRWCDLLPSTQKDLTNVSWSDVLDYDVTP